MPDYDKELTDCQAAFDDFIQSGMTDDAAWDALCDLQSAGDLSGAVDRCCICQSLYHSSTEGDFLDFVVPELAPFEDFSFCGYCLDRFRYNLKLLLEDPKEAWRYRWESPERRTFLFCIFPADSYDPYRAEFYEINQDGIRLVDAADTLDDLLLGFYCQRIHDVDLTLYARIQAHYRRWNNWRRKTN